MFPKTPDEWRKVGLDKEAILRLNERLHNNKLVVQKIISETSFIVYHENYMKDFILSRIDDNENLETWLNMGTHSNIITCYD